MNKTRLHALRRRIGETLKDPASAEQARTLCSAIYCLSLATDTPMIQDKWALKIFDACVESVEEYSSYEARAHVFFESIERILNDPATPFTYGALTFSVPVANEVAPRVIDGLAALVAAACRVLDGREADGLEVRARLAAQLESVLDGEPAEAAPVVHFTTYLPRREKGDDAA